jgi:hypothetical protein
MLPVLRCLLPLYLLTTPVWANVLPDPAAEGWTSESFAAEAQSKLGSLLKEKVWPKTTTEQRIFGQWHPAPAPEGLQHFLLTPVSAADGWAELQKWLAAVEPMVWKVKTIGVGEQSRETTHLLHGMAKTSDGRVEFDATWRCGWAADGSLRSAVAEKAAATRTKDAASWFTDKTAALLEKCRYGNAHWQLRVPTWAGFFKFGHHGGALADVNGDGLVDLYVCQDAGLPNRLFLHTPEHLLEDVSTQWGLDLLDATQTALFVDWDGDGDNDAAVATSGPLLIYENTGRKFEQRLRFPAIANVYTLAASDVDGDGDVDLYAGRYFAGAEDGGSMAIPTPPFAAENGGANFLIRNDGSFRFSDATAALGLDANNKRFTYAAVWDDFNADQRPDLYVANDYGVNNLYIQGDQGKFQDRAVEAGLAGGAFGMSASTADVDGDGLPDLHLGAMYSSAGNRITTQAQFGAGHAAQFQRMAQGNRLYRNLAGLQFSDVTDTAGIAMGRWSWGAVFGDINNDARPDLLVGNGFVTGAVPDDL